MRSHRRFLTLDRLEQFGDDLHRRSKTRLQTMPRKTANDTPEMTLRPDQATGICVESSLTGESCRVFAMPGNAPWTPTIGAAYKHLIRMSDPKTFGTTVPGASTHGKAGGRAQLGAIWVFPFPTTLSTRFEGTRIVLGRSDDCDVVLRGAEASRHHAEFLRIGSEWIIHDLGSRNGVYVDGQRVEHFTLRVGNVLRVGEWIGIVRPFESNAENHQAHFRQLAPGLFGAAQLQAAVIDAERVAQSNVRIVVQGETGTGKERVAQAIHHWSGRTGEFVGVNCAALPEGLVEGELFGYRKGAFTGAERANVGHFRAAHGGTLLLDEVTEMPLSVQPKLLRALEERAVVPLGESIAVPVDVRVVTATQEPLQQAVAEKRFRADLCARLAGLTIVLPPLRERKEDIVGLFAHLLERHLDGALPAVDPRLVERLCGYAWPYNVREIDQLASYLAGAHRHEQVLRCAHLPKTMQTVGVSENSLAKHQQHDEDSMRQSLVRQQVEKQLERDEELEALRRALRLHCGNMTRAASALGISRQRAYRILQGAPPSELEEIRKLTESDRIDRETPKPE
jgi:DNA-binding NtrC family response regulator